MVVIKCKIISAGTDETGLTTINLTLTDAQGVSWPKSYTFRYTETMDLNKFKAQVITDIRKDLKISNVLEQISPLVGQTFNLNV